MAANGGSVELSVTLALAGLIREAKQVQEQLKRQIPEFQVPVKPTIPEGAYRDALGRLRDAKGRFIKEGEEAGEGYGDGFKDGLGDTIDSVINGALERVGQRITDAAISGLQQAVGAVTNLGQTALEASDKLNGSIAAVNSLGADGQGTADALGALSERLGGLASKNDLVAAAYDVLSSKTDALAAGLSDAEVATNILEAATKGAVGGFSDTATVADALTSVLNSYRLSATEAEAVTAKIIATQNAGKITAGQYAAQIGRLAPTAAQAGVSLDELNGFIATATSQGVPIESTFSGIRQAISAILKPSDEAQEILESIGITNGAAALQSEGLVGVLGRLQAAGKATPEVLNKLLGSVEALTAIAPATGANYETLTANILRSQEALANNEAENALNAVASTATTSFANAMNLAQNELIELGDKIAPVRNEFLKLAATLLNDVFQDSTAFFAIETAVIRFQEAIQDNPELLEAISKSAVQLADSLGQVTVALLDAVTGFIDSGNAAKTFQEITVAIEYAGDVLSTIAMAIEFVARNAEILKTVLEALFIRFVALQAISFAKTLAAMGLQMGLLTQASGALSLSLGGVATASKAAVASLAPLLVQLALLAAAIELVKFYKLIADMTESNQALDDFNGRISRATQGAIDAANRTKASVEAVNAARKAGRQLTIQEIEENKRLIEANKLRLEQLKQDLALAQQLPAANEEQLKSRENLVRTLQVSIGALEKQNSALVASVGPQKAATEATKQGTEAAEEQADALQALTDKYDGLGSARESRMKESEALIQEALASGEISEEDARDRSLANEAQYLQARLQLNRDKLAELKELRSNTTDPEQLKKIEEEIASTESEIFDQRIETAQKVAEARKAVEEKALADIQRANEQANAAIERSQQERTIAIRQAQADGVISAEEAEKQIRAIQSDTSAQLIAQKQAELAQVQALKQQGLISEEEAAERITALQGEINSATLSRIESEIEANRRAVEEELRNIQLVADTRNRLELAALDRKSAALQRQNDLLSSQARLVDAIAGFQNSQLEGAIANAEATGRTAEATRLRLQLQEQQQAQLIQQEAIQNRQLILEQQQAQLAAQREISLSRQKELQLENEIIAARRTGATQAEIDNLNAQLQIQRQFTQDAIAGQAQLQEVQANDRLTQQVQQATARQDLNRQQVGELTQLGQQGGFSREISARLNQLRTTPVMAPGGLDLRQLSTPAVVSPQLATPNLQPARAATMPPLQLEGLGQLNSTVERISSLVAGMEIGNTFNISGVENAEQAAQRVAAQAAARKRRMAGR